MKVDVQGSDLFAMRGARETIRKHCMPIVFEFEALFQEEFGTSWTMYEEFIREIGYRITANDGPNFLIEPVPAAVAKLRYNQPLLTMAQVDRATVLLRENGWPEHPDRTKNWDTWLAAIQPGSYRDCDPILDAGGSRVSAFLPAMRLRGFTNLTSINLDETTEWVDGISYVRGDITGIARPDSYYAYIACLSVIEHGVDVRAFFKEMGRVIRPDGQLFVSFDYWETPIDCGDRMAFGAPVRIFHKRDVEDMIGIAADAGLYIEDTYDLQCQDRVCNWIGLDFTFMNLLMRRKAA
jgi:SAM-dependent methyltransferase